MMKVTQPAVDAVDGLLSLARLLNTSGLEATLSSVKDAAATAVAAETAAAMAEQSAKAALAAQVEAEARAVEKAEQAEQDYQRAVSKLRQADAVAQAVAEQEGKLADERKAFEAHVAAETTRLQGIERAAADDRAAAAAALADARAEQAKWEAKTAKLRDAVAD
jgi:hypothetical protein